MGPGGAKQSRGRVAVVPLRTQCWPWGWGFGGAPPAPPMPWCLLGDGPEMGGWRYLGKLETLLGGMSNNEP